MQLPDELFEPDISARVRRDFNTVADVVFQQLLEFRRECQPCPRIVRCIVHAAQGRLSGVTHYIEMARTDFRDLILTAEYQTRPGTKRWQGIHDHVHDFNLPYAE